MLQLDIYGVQIGLFDTKTLLLAFKKNRAETGT
jgi:hypothetical protein